MISDNSSSTSIVVTNYNRRALVPGAIASALAWIERVGAGEVILVDDASTDGSLEAVADRFGDEIGAGTLKLVALPRNLGVTGAKNEGVERASGDWILFLDSDDELVPDEAPAVAAEMRAPGDIPVLFFRAMEFESGRLIGQVRADPFEADARSLIHGWRYGDCLPIVRRSVMRRWPFVAELRGYEGLSWLRIARHVGPIRVVPRPALRVRLSGSDRLSDATARALGPRDVKARRLILKEFGDMLPPLARLRWRASIVRAAAMSLRPGRKRGKPSR
jgi:glycosyltransferase involved in cell wall biosynthesis